MDVYVFELFLVIISDVYCVALDNSVETGLKQYLQNLQSDDESLEPDYICRLLQFAIDICSALCHIQSLKVCIFVVNLILSHKVLIANCLKGVLACLSRCLPYNPGFMGFRPTSIGTMFLPMIQILVTKADSRLIKICSKTFVTLAS